MATAQGQHMKSLRRIPEALEHYYNKAVAKLFTPLAAPTKEASNE